MVKGVTAGGKLEGFAATRGELEVFSTHDGRLPYFGWAAEFKHDPLAVLPLTDDSRHLLLRSGPVA